MAEQVPTIKITMLGNSGAGKTCFMLGMYSTMRLGVNGFTFAAKDMDVDLDLSDAWDQIVDGEGEERWPQSTAQTTPYSFAFCYGLEELMTFDWIDYRGSALRTRKSDPTFQNEVQGLIDYLQRSDCVFLCLSCEHLMKDKKNDASGVAKRADYVRMLQFMESVESSNRAFKPAIVIVLTKYDLVPEAEEEEIVETIKGIFHPFFAASSNWLTMICPVTLGVDLSESSTNGDIDPQNIHLPVTFAIYYAHRKMRDTLQRQRTSANESLSAPRSFWQILTGGDKRKRTQADVIRYEEHIREMDQKMKLLVRQLMEGAKIYFSGEETELDI